MLSLYSNEIVRRSTSTCFACSALARSSRDLLISAKSRQPHPSHQRKHSSSKASNPSKDDNKSIATTARDSTKQQGMTTTSSPNNISTPRIRRRKLKGIPQDTGFKGGQFAYTGLPSVPSTQSIHPLDIHLASFFSQHRPISVSHVIPPATTPEAFASLFVTSRASSTNSPQDVIETLSSTVDNLDRMVAQHNDAKIPEELDIGKAVTLASSSSPGNTNGPGNAAKALHISLKDMTEQYRPFMPPAPPVPAFAPNKAEPTMTKQQAVPEPARIEPSAKHTAYTSTLTVYETIYPDGNRSYKTFTSPLVRESSASLPPSDHQAFDPVQTDGENTTLMVAGLSIPESEDPESIAEPTSAPPFQPFMERMREQKRRWYAREETLRAISVKRQRKLKMKKHKHKKLLKRTRNLRRKLERGS